MIATATQLCEHAGAALGMLGAWFVSGGDRRAKWGWIAWLLSNGLLAAMAFELRLWSLLTMQCYFAVTSLRGLMRSIRADKADGPSNPCSK